VRALILAEGGDDLRKLPLSLRKANLERCWRVGRKGIFIRLSAARSVLISSLRL
jgi:hypothetical protein